MKKLADLREHLLSDRFELEADLLTTYAEEGSVLARVADKVTGFGLTYTGVVIVEKFAKDPLPVYFGLLEWLNRHEPGRGDDAISFQVDILDSKTVNLAFQIELTERMLVEHGDEGADIRIVPDPAHDPSNINSFTGL